MRFPKRSCSIVAAAALALGCGTEPRPPKSYLRITPAAPTMFVGQRIQLKAIGSGYGCADHPFLWKTRQSVDSAGMAVFSLFGFSGSREGPTASVTGLRPGDGIAIVDWCAFSMSDTTTVTVLDSI